MSAALIVALAAVAVALVAVALAVRRRRPALARRGVERILIPFTGGALDPTVLAAGIRIARAEEATLVPAYLIVVPLEQPQDAAMQQEVGNAMPLLEAVEHAALRAGVPVDARIERGRSAIHALQRLWQAEPFDRIETALTNFFRLDKLAALRELVLRELAEDVEAKRTTAVLDPLSLQAVAERILVLVTPEPRSQRILRRAFRSGQRLGSEIDALWVRRPGQQPTEEEATQLAALRRLASVLGIHFLEEEGDELVPTVRRVARERGSTYVFVGTPDESRRREILGGSLLSRMVRELPGIDIRVFTDRALKEPRPE